MTVAEFAQNCHALSVQFPYSVTSWGRTKKRNAAVGGHPDSWHQLWLGLDGVLDDPNDLPAFTRRARYFGIKVIDEGSHLHLQPL